MENTQVIAARAALYLVSLGIAGVPLYLRIAGVARAGGSLRAALAVAAGLAAAISAWWAAASVAAMAAMPLGELDYATYSAVAAATPIGTVLSVRLAGCAAILLCIAAFPRTLWLGLIAASVAIVGAWTGHAGAAEGGIGHVQRAFDALHLVAAAVWFGALLCFLASLYRNGAAKRATLITRLQAFAGTGTIVVTVLAITGGINGWLIARHGFAWSSAWTGLLMAKLALFAAMLCLAAFNRWKLTPAYASHEPGAASRLRISLSLETACAIAIFALVAAIGLSDPGGTP